VRPACKGPLVPTVLTMVLWTCGARAPAGRRGTLALPEGFRITTAMLWQGALVLALADLALLLPLTRLVDTAAFQQLAPTFYWCVIALGPFAIVRAAAAPRRRRAS
jgi:hypothetical protein